MTHDTGSAGSSGKELLAISAARRNAEIANTLTGQAEDLGIGVADDGVGIDLGDVIDISAIVGQLTVGLVSNHINGMAVLSILTVQKFSQSFQSFLGVDRAGRIVGRVDNDGLGIGGDALFHLGKVDLEIFIVRRTYHKLMTGVLAEGAILGEVRGDADDLAAGIAQCLQHAHQRRCSATGQEDMLHADRGIGAHCQISSHCAAGIGIAGCGGIAMDNNMAKAAINKTFKLNASGILAIYDGKVAIENPDTGELIMFDKLLADFADKSVKLSVTYDFDYESVEDDEE